MRRDHSLVATLFLTAVAPFVARAQAPTFHARQWGAEFAINSGANVTLLRFTSPSAAWLLSFGGSVTSSDNELPDATTRRLRAWDGTIRLGHRTYSSDTASVRPFHSLGGLASGSRSTDGTVTTNSWSLGGFVDLGATWLVTPHLGLTGLGELNVVYFRQTNKQTVAGVPQRFTSSGWNASVGRLRVVGSMYF